MQKYSQWLHGKWPTSSSIEALPLIHPDGSCNIPHIRIVGDLTGIPLLKFAADSGARAVHSILAEKDFQKGGPTLDLAIIGAGPSGISAAIAASKAGLNYAIFESSTALSTLRNFPQKKPIFTYPTAMIPTGGMQLTATTKEDLITQLEAQQTLHSITPTTLTIEKISRTSGLLKLHTPDQPILAKRAIIAIGRTGNFRRLNIPGETLPKVSNRLIDPSKFAHQHILVIGGGDTAIEAAIALAQAGATVSLSHRSNTLTRPKPENLKTLHTLTSSGRIHLHPASTVTHIHQDHITLTSANNPTTTLRNDHVFTLIGRAAPLDFFRKSGIKISGEKTPTFYTTLTLTLTLCIWLYHWKKGLYIPAFLNPHPSALLTWWHAASPTATALKNSLSDPSFFYSLTYCLCVLIFGIRRIRKRKTPYVTLQTITLTTIQWLPLFILPYLILPYLGATGTFTHGGLGQWFGETFLSNGPGTPPDQYWRSFGFILAWPLFIFNIFTDAPLWGWLILSFIQTFILIPLIVWRWGKGAYCGWICSCGALAETLGDSHRGKMPHGPLWNKLNLLGQAILLLTLLLLTLRITGWIFPSTGLNTLFKSLVSSLPIANYSYLIDLWLSSILGVGLYFHFSGRTWCRFACPLAALMHIYARFSRFRIFSEKAKCISCNLCTTSCHQGIDVMAFAATGTPMEDPQCVRCSACVSSCPTGTLSFGRLDHSQKPIFDTLPASLIQLTERRKPK